MKKKPQTWRRSSEAVESSLALLSMTTSLGLLLLSKELYCLSFSLAEMHAFLDAEDKRVGDPEIIGADEVRFSFKLSLDNFAE